MEGALHVTVPHQNSADASEIVLASSLPGTPEPVIEKLHKANLSVMLKSWRHSSSVRHLGLNRLYTAEDFKKILPMSADRLASLSPPDSLDLIFDASNPGPVLRSSGTSRRPKFMYHSWQFNEQVGRLGARGLLDHGQSPPRGIANWFYPSELMGGAFLFVQEVAKHLPARVFPMGSQCSVEEMLETIHTHYVDTLACTPAQCMDLIENAGEKSLGTLETVLYIGEDFGAERLARVAQLQPSLDVRSLAYSTSETGPIGYQCQHCTGTEHHIHSDVVLVEIIDEDGSDARAGQIGDLIVTPLTDKGIALPRYQIGDRAALETTKCPCGSPTPILRLYGRDHQSANIDTKVISESQLSVVFEEFGIIDTSSYQVQYKQNALDVEVFVVIEDRVLQEVNPNLSEIFGALHRQPQIRSLIDSRSCRKFLVCGSDERPLVRTLTGKMPKFAQL